MQTRLSDPSKILVIDPANFYNARRLLLLSSLFFPGSLLSQNMIMNDPVSATVFKTEKYAGIKCSPFLFEEWMKGTASFSTGTYINLELKPDAYENILYFKRDNETNSFKNDIMEFMLMPDGSDSSGYLYFRKEISGEGLKPHQFVQVLAEGNASLYRSDIKLQSEINAGMVKTFTTSIRYFIMKNGVLHLIRLNKKDVLRLLEDQKDQIEGHINTQKLSLKKQSDLVNIIHYYNSLYPL